MSPSPYLLSIDVGTDSCKTMLFNARGESQARSHQEYPIIILEPSWVKQDPNRWWNAVKKTVSNTLKTSHSDPKNIECVSITGQSPVLAPVDRNGKALMNAIIWMDRRAINQAKTVMGVTGYLKDPSMILPKILWIKENQPSIFGRTHKFLQTTDFIAHKLIGNFVTDWLNADTCHYGPEEDDWSRKLLDRLGIPAEKLPDVSEPTKLVGTITEETAEETGLKKGTPVMATGTDAYMALVGVNALQTGIVCEMTGSSTCIMITSSHEIVDSAGRVVCKKFPLLPNFWVTWAVMSSTGASLRWFRDKLGHRDESYEAMDAEAEKVEAGSQRLVFLPHMMGELSPLLNPSARELL